MKEIAFAAFPSDPVAHKDKTPGPLDMYTKWKKEKKKKKTSPIYGV
jgi:hypothetical protein